MNRPWGDLPMAWIAGRACTPADLDLFFSDNDPSRLKARFAELEAKAICQRCPVQVDCLEHAIAVGEHGIWGGTTSEERRKMKKAGSRRRVPGVSPPAP